jgi:hypothetical protein
LVWQGQGWQPLYAAISAWVLGYYDPVPSAEQFAHLIARWQRGQAGLAVNGVLSRTPWRKMLECVTRGVPADYVSPLTGLRRPHGLDQIIETFGDPRAMTQADWEGYYIRPARAPGSHRFTLVDGGEVQTLRFHRAFVPHAEAFLQAVARGGLWDELQPVSRAYEWDPSGANLHTWGIALDLRPAQYAPSSRELEYPGPENYPPGYLVRHIQSYGWQWGLWFSISQPGHLQFATGLEGCSLQ